MSDDYWTNQPKGNAPGATGKSLAKLSYLDGIAPLDGSSEKTVPDALHPWLIHPLDTDTDQTAATPLYAVIDATHVVGLQDLLEASGLCDAIAGTGSLHWYE